MGAIKRLRRDYKKFRKGASLEGLPLMHRNPILLGLEGWYRAESPFHVPYYDEWSLAREKGATRLGFSRWLAKRFPGDPALLARIGKMVAASTFSFKISCRHNDILRMATTKHFNSCFAPGGEYTREVRYLLSDPDFGVIYVPDSKGDFRFRMGIRLVKRIAPLEKEYSVHLSEYSIAREDEGRDGWGIYLGRPYGERLLGEAIARYLAGTVKDRGLYTYGNYALLMEKCLITSYTPCLSFGVHAYTDEGMMRIRFRGIGRQGIDRQVFEGFKWHDRLAPREKEKGKEERR